MMFRVLLIFVLLAATSAVSQENWQGIVVPAGGTPEAFRDPIRSETAKWAQVVQAAKIQPE